MQRGLTVHPAGAFPPLIGWAAATGDVALLPLLLFGLVFLWTPPHFWALALFVKTDYANAGVPMLPVVAGERVTRTQIGLYTIPMIAAAIAPWPLGLVGPLYGWSAILLNAVFLILVLQVATRRSAPDDTMVPEKRLPSSGNWHSITGLRWSRICPLRLASVIISASA